MRSIRRLASENELEVAAIDPAIAMAATRPSPLTIRHLQCLRVELKCFEEVIMLHLLKILKGAALALAVAESLAI
jgi:hypothetical protein